MNIIRHQQSMNRFSDYYVNKGLEIQGFLIIIYYALLCIVIINYVLHGWISFGWAGNPLGLYYLQADFFLLPEILINIISIAIIIVLLFFGIVWWGMSKQLVIDSTGAPTKDPFSKGYVYPAAEGEQPIQAWEWLIMHGFFLVSIALQLIASQYLI